MNQTDTLYRAGKIIDMVVAENSTENISLFHPACKLAVVDIRRAGAFAESAGRVGRIFNFPKTVGINIVASHASFSR